MKILEITFKYNTPQTLLALVSRTVVLNLGGVTTRRLRTVPWQYQDKYDVLLVVEHGLYPPKLDVKQDWHDRMCTAMKSSYSSLSYNIHDGDDTPWNQYGGTGVTLIADTKS